MVRFPQGTLSCWSGVTHVCSWSLFLVTFMMHLLRQFVKRQKTSHTSETMCTPAAQMIHCHKQTSTLSSLPDDDWQEEHKRLAELDERDGLGGGLGLGAGGMGGESNLGGAGESSSARLSSSAVQLPMPSSLPSLKFSSSSSGLPPSGQWCN